MGRCKTTTYTTRALVIRPQGSGLRPRTLSVQPSPSLLDFLLKGIMLVHGSSPSHRSGCWLRFRPISNRANLARSGSSKVCGSCPSRKRSFEACRDRSAVRALPVAAACVHLRCPLRQVRPVAMRISQLRPVATCRSRPRSLRIARCRHHRRVHRSRGTR